MEVFNELVTVITIIILSCFLTTDFVAVTDVRLKLSLFLLGLIFLDFLIPCLISLVLIYRAIRLKILKYRLNKNKVKQDVEKASNKPAIQEEKKKELDRRPRRKRIGNVLA